MVEKLIVPTNNNRRERASFWNNVRSVNEGKGWKGGGSSSVSLVGGCTKEDVLTKITGLNLKGPTNYSCAGLTSLDYCAQLPMKYEMKFIEGTKFSEVAKSSFGGFSGFEASLVVSVDPLAYL